MVVLCGLKSLLELLIKWCDVSDDALNPSSLTGMSFLGLTSLSKFAKHFAVDACGMDHEIAILRGILFKRFVNDTEVSFDQSASSTPSSTPDTPSAPPVKKLAPPMFGSSIIVFIQNFM